MDLAMQKAADVFRTRQDRVVLGFDTMVYIDREPLGKPKSSGRRGPHAEAAVGTDPYGRHRHARSSRKDRRRSFCERADVAFHPMTDAEIAGYCGFRRTFRTRPAPTQSRASARSSSAGSTAISSPSWGFPSPASTTSFEVARPLAARSIIGPFRRSRQPHKHPSPTCSHPAGFRFFDVDVGNTWRPNRDAWCIMNAAGSETDRQSPKEGMRSMRHTDIGFFRNGLTTEGTQN
ncbi:MAG: Maf family protein [Bacillus subtilis]|nr:Maf family protein [Bacillus subtilis]